MKRQRSTCPSAAVHAADHRQKERSASVGSRFFGLRAALRKRARIGVPRIAGSLAGCAFPEDAEAIAARRPRDRPARAPLFFLNESTGREAARTGRLPCVRGERGALGAERDKAGAERTFFRPFCERGADESPGKDSTSSEERN